jgi:hypothetical protein
MFMTSLKLPLLISTPEIKILKDAPDTAGNIDCFMVIVDRTVFPVEKYGNLDEWFEENEGYILDGIRDDDFKYPVYVLHFASIDEGDDIIPLIEKDIYLKQFSTNIVFYDSSLTSHCIATIETDDSIYIKSGCHYWSACNQKGYDGPTSYDSMSKIYDGEYSFLKIDRNRFWSLYYSALNVWTVEVTNERIAERKKRFDRYEKSILK